MKRSELKRTPFKRKPPKHAAKDKKVKDELRKRYDPFCCLFCGVYESEYTIIDAAHLLGKGPHPEYRTVVENLIPLCRTCHSAYDQNAEIRDRMDVYHGLDGMKERIKAGEFRPFGE